jgi:hypothetical protein
MTTSSEARPFRTKIVSRPEGSGFLIYVPESGAYLYATVDGRDLISLLADTPTTDDPVSSVARRFGLTANDAESRIQFVRHLLNRSLPDETAVSMSHEREGIGVWLLEEIMGDKGQRCETFGMPF